MQHFPNYAPRNSGVLQDVNKHSVQKSIKQKKSQIFTKFAFSVFDHSYRSYS